MITKLPSRNTTGIAKYCWNQLPEDGQTTLNVLTTIHYSVNTQKRARI